MQTMQYGVIICPRCSVPRVADLRVKTTKCSSCGRPLQMKKMRLYGHADSPQELIPRIGELNRERCTLLQALHENEQEGWRDGPKKWDNEPDERENEPDEWENEPDEWENEPDEWENGPEERGKRLEERENRPDELVNESGERGKGQEGRENGRGDGENGPEERENGREEGENGLELRKNGLEELAGDTVHDEDPDSSVHEEPSDRNEGYPGTGRSQQPSSNRMNRLREALTTMGEFTVEDLEQIVMGIGWKREKGVELLLRMMESGEAYSPRRGWFRMVP